MGYARLKHNMHGFNYRDHAHNRDQAHNKIDWCSC
jgi:hypothetical protein